MTAPHVASDNTAILDAEAAKVANAERHLRAMVDAFAAMPPLKAHLDNLIAAAEGLREARIGQRWVDLERRADAVRALR